MLPPPSEGVALRPLERGDLHAIGEMAAAQARNVGERDYARLLDLEGARAYVLAQDDALLGVGTAMRYFEHGFLGPVLLRRDLDSPGLAIALLAQLIESIQRDGVLHVESEAGVLEEPILDRMGFRAVRRTLVLERGAGERPPPAATSPMEQHHLLDVGSLDAEAVGYGRKDYLAALRAELPAGARVFERDGEVAGFCLLRALPRGHQLGPLVTRAGDVEAARALVRDALRAAEAPVVALAAEGATADLLLAEGFREVGRLTRMRAGEPPSREALGAATEWTLGGRMTG